MASAEHYCATCDTHFTADPQQHAKTYHRDGIFEGVLNGDWRDYFR